MERNMRKMVALAAVVGSTLAVLSLAGPAVGADGALPKSGDFELRYTWVNPTTSGFGDVDRGGDRGSIGAGGWIGWLMRNDGNSASAFGHKMSGKCVAMFGMTASGYDVVLGDCDYSDTDGDHLFEHFEGLKGTFVSGTGKYAGVSASFDLTDIVVSSQSGYGVLSGVKVGSYTIK